MSGVSLPSSEAAHDSPKGYPTSFMGMRVKLNGRVRFSFSKSWQAVGMAANIKSFPQATVLKAFVQEWRQTAPDFGGESGSIFWLLVVCVEIIPLSNK